MGTTLLARAELDQFVIRHRRTMWGTDFIHRGRSVRRLPITTSLGEFCLENLSKRSVDDKVLITEINGEEHILTAGNVLHYGKLVSIFLQENGLQPEDTFMLTCGNTLDVAPIFLGGFLSGIVPFPVHPEAGTRDFKHLLNTVKPKLVFCDEVSHDGILTAVSESESLIPVMPLAVLREKLTTTTSTDTFRLAQIADTYNHLAVIMPSSGTTGPPKGVEITQHSLLYMLMSSKENMADVSVGINIAGPSWASGMYYHSLALCSGGTLVILPKFGEREYLEAIQKYKVNISFIGPSPVTALAKWEDTDKYDVSSLRYMLAGGSKVSNSIIELLERKMRVPFAILYGLTETFISFDPAFGAVGKRGSAGTISTNSLAKVVDVDTGKPLGPNCEGEICLLTMVMLKGYRGNPEATKALFDEDGFLHTGDIGYYDEDGYFYVVDRMKELIKYKFTHLSATDIEEVLLRHPDVKEAAVVGIEHEIDVERPTAFVIKQPNSVINAQDLMIFVENNLSELKWLHGGVVFVDDLPRTVSGKIRKRDLRSALQAGKTTPERRDKRT